MGFGSGVKTTLPPGWVLLRFEETICHDGAPIRIAISVNSDNNFDQHILADHIPHNDAGSCSDANPSPYSYKVKIPDINCPNCALSLVNPMTDKLQYYGLSSCNYPGNPDNCPSVYHSCADIAISGTGNPATLNTTNPTYRAYTPNEAATWELRSGRWVFPANYDNNQTAWSGSSSTGNPSGRSSSSGLNAALHASAISGCCILLLAFTTFTALLPFF
jgi:hypothetical protein